MSVPYLAWAVIPAAFFLFASASTAFADGGTLAAVAGSLPARILLGLGGVAFAAALTRAQVG